MSRTPSCRTRGCLVDKRAGMGWSDYAVGGISLGLHLRMQLIALVGHTIECCETLEHKEPPMLCHRGLANFL